MSRVDKAPSLLELSGTCVAPALSGRARSERRERVRCLLFSALGGCDDLAGWLATPGLGGLTPRDLLLRGRDEEFARRFGDPERRRLERPVGDGTPS
ncbi:hypothetical protein [Miltoncostaea oceani]|uniref:hypothetical protein n=1 Tax=Miltoncostaea oceani TaxID=2843216 RepID=UPI001C3C7CD6|nr:hypothetical protein [Miltoncostaea oceani]